MSILSHASLYYGQLRGYNRATISTRVNATLHRSAQEVQTAQMSDFRARVVASAQRFPFYAERIREHLGSLPTIRDDFRPVDLPLWTKADQREFFSTLDANDFQSCFLHSSGGSTGVPIRFYMTRESYEWRAAVARRGYAFAQAEPGKRAFFVWSDDAIEPDRLKRLKTTILNWADNRQFFNCFFFDRQQIRLCCDAINRFKPQAIIGYAGKLVELAIFCRETPNALKWRAPNIVTAAEGLQPGQRELLEEHLGDNVVMSYGSREFMLIGMESRERCGYHLADDNLLVEVVDSDGMPVPAGETGQIAITDLHNDANPFVRYLIGDLGRMQPDDEPEPKGLPFRRLLEVQGRNQEFVFTPEGGKLTLIYFAHNIKEFSWVDAFQIVQPSRSHLIIRVCSSKLITTKMKQQLEAQLRPKLGAARIDVRQVEELTRRPNGKIAVLVSELSESSFTAVHADA